jgi:universal stress protein A
MLQVRGILQPTDFSDVANHAFRFACGLAQRYQAPLVVLHVSTGLAAFKGENLSAERPAQYLEKVWAQLETYQWPGVEIHRSIEEGDPVEQILRASQTFPCDLIVMGSHGRSGVKRLLLGSVAEQIIRRATCPVLIVKEPPSPPGYIDVRDSAAP